jgi:hypothetical protein
VDRPPALSASPSREGASVGAHLRRTFLAIGHLPEHGTEREHERVDTFLVYVHKFREVGHGWDRVD